MPIRINLLAEAQAAEEMRRKDPVKRAIWVGGFLIVLMLVWSSSLQMKALLARGELGRIESQLSSRSNEFRSVLEQQQVLQDTTMKLQSLACLASNRVLYGNVMNALQHCIVPDVELVRFQADQSYLFKDAIKAKTNTSGKVVPAVPAMATEKTSLVLDAKDSGPVPGDQVNKFRGTLALFPYFKQALGTNEVRLANLAPPQTGPDGKNFVLFTLDCKYPEVTR